MRTFARWNFHIHGFNKGQKHSRYESLKQVEKTLGRTPEGLIPPPFPLELEHVWVAFDKLKKANAGPISFCEIKAYCELLDDPLTSNDVELLLDLNMIFSAESG